jgi:hypothetical protein
MKKLNMKKDEVQYLKRNWKALTDNTHSVMNEALDYVMASVEKDLEIVLDRTNRVVLEANKWIKVQHDRIHKTLTKSVEELDHQAQMARMDDEGGAGFINTLPHETSPSETSNAPEHRH